MKLFSFLLLLILIGCQKPISENTELLRVVGNSMEPTLKNQDIVLADYDYYKIYPVERNQLVAIDLKQPKPIVKRVVALPGDTVSRDSNGRLLVNNNFPANRSIYLSTNSIFYKQITNYNYVIPNNSFLAIGDNQGNSVDSVDYGVVARSQIIGRVFLTS